MYSGRALAKRSRADLLFHGNRCVTARGLSRLATLGAVTSTGTRPAPSALLLLGHGSDPVAERGVECPGELPEPSDPTLVERARAAKAALGERVFVLGHHYQRDEVIQFADVTGDSFKLARDAAARPQAEYIVFCGVHFMAESADILTAPDQQVLLPDLAAGCSMADMADHQQVVEAWDVLTDAGLAGDTVPITYMNSSAAIKAFTGAHGGTVCTSSNADRALRWAFDRGERVLFLPDQHLGRNTAVLELGIPLERVRRLRPAPARRRAHAAAAARGPDGAVAGALLGARALQRRRGGRRAPAGPRRDGAGAPGVPPRRGARCRPGRLHRVHHRRRWRRPRPDRRGRSAPS